MQGNSKLWDRFPGSDIQEQMHASLVARLRKSQLDLETCNCDVVPALQERIQALRELIRMIHEHDPAAVKSRFQMP